MSAQGIRAGRAYVEIGTNMNPLEKGLRSVQQRLSSFGRMMTVAGGALVGAGTAVIAPMLHASTVFAKSGDELSKMADKTGASVESLSELRHAAQQSAVEFNQLGSAINKQQRNMSEALSGNKEAADAFDRVGLSVSELQKLSVDQQFELIAQRISEIEDPALRTGAAMDIFGRSGAELMPLMLNGAAGIQALRKEARDLGLQVSSKDAKAATLLGDTWANLIEVLKDIQFEIGAALGPALTDLMQTITPMIVSVASWISENRQLVVTVAAVAAGVAAAGAVLTGFGLAALVASAAIGGLLTVGAALTPVLAAVLSPMGLLIGLTAGLIAAFLRFTGVGQQVGNWFGSQFTKLSTIVSDTVGGMFDALMAGRLDLAAKIAFTGIKLALVEAMDAVLGIFGSSVKQMVGILGELQKQFGRVQSGLKIAGDKIGTTFSVAREKQRLAQQFQNERERQIKTGTLGSDEGRARLDRIAKQIEDVQRGGDSGHRNAVANIMQEQADFERRIDAQVRANQGALDTQGLQDGLAALRDEAAKDRTRVTTDPLRLADLNLRLDNLPDVEARHSTAGTFSAAQAAAFTGERDDIPKKQLEMLDKISRNTETLRRATGLVATA